jgi:RecA/RadA recombinase
MKKLAIKSGSKSLLAKISTKLDNAQPEKESDGTFRHARSTEDSPTFIRYVVTTGIRTFDDRVGGMPIGKATELCGKPKSGKTNMAVRTCVRAQQGFIYERVQTPDGGITLEQLKPGTFNVTILYYDNEGSLSDFNNRVVDGTVMDGEIIQCETVELLWKTMDDVMDVVDAEQIANPDVIQFLIVVIDTVGVMTTKVELDAAWGKMDFPRVPMQLKAGFKAMTSRMQRENVLLIGLNHVSRKMTTRYGQPAYKGWNYDSPGGLAFSYCATHQVYFEMLEKKYCLRSRGEADGILVYFLTEKNRMLPMLRQCNLALLFGLKDRKTGKLLQEGGFKDTWSILEALLYHKAAKISKQTGAVIFYFEKFGIPMTTFGAAATPSLEESDDAAAPVPTARRMAARPGARTADTSKKKDPRIPNRLAWLEFYEQHKADLEALYELVTDRSLQGSMAVALPSVDDEEEGDEEEGGE